MFILNGRFDQDRNVGAMTFRNTSVIDYSIVSSNTFDILSDFRIIEVDQLFSDEQSLLRVDCAHAVIRRRLSILVQETNHSRILLSPQNFDQNKANDILSVLESCDTESCEATINLVVHQISNAFKSAASKTQSGKNVKFKTKRGNNRP